MILDQYGKPITARAYRDALAEPQTAKVRFLKREFERHPSRGLTPQKLAAILEGAEQGDLLSQAELFADMEEKDGHILAEMGKRKRALLTLPWSIVPPANATAAETRLAEEVKEWLAARADLDDLITDLMDAAGHAYSCVEIEWGRLGREWHPAKLCHRLPTWFQLDRETRSELRLRDMSADGEPLNPFGWIVHIHKAKSGHISRAGLHRALAWPYLFKNYAVRDLAEFLEIYGLPTRIGKYPPVATEEEKRTLLRAVTDIGHNAAGIMPIGMEFELMEAAEGTQGPFQFMIDLCERTESKVILGQVLSAEAKPTGLGSGVAQLQSEVRDDLKVSDARQVGGTLSRDLVYPWIVVNRGGVDPRRAPRFVFDTQEAEDLKLYSEALPKFVDMGMRIPLDYAHERLKIPKAKEGDEILVAAKKPAAAAPDAEPAQARRRDRLRLAVLRAGDDDPAAAAHARVAQDQELIEQAAAALSGDWAEQLGPRVEELIAHAEATGDFTTFSERLVEVLRSAPVPKLVEALERSGFVAQLLGRTEQR